MSAGDPRRAIEADRRLAAALTARRLVTPAALAAAVDEQRARGGAAGVRLAAILEARGLVPRPTLDALLVPTPADPVAGASPRVSPRPQARDAGPAGHPTPGDVPDDVAAAMGDPRRHLGRYILTAELGRGGMGVVYAGWDPTLRRRVAIKVILSTGPARDVSVERFVQEARAAARLRHPGIVAVHEAGEHEGRPYIVMDFIEGETLAAAIEREGSLPPRRAADVVRAVALALDHAHGHGIVHRDVKPHNVLVDREGGVHLTDFGVARDVTTEKELTATGQLIGTPAYAAPEQLKSDRAAVGPRADVYAAGAVLYHAVTGRPPHVGGSLLEIIAAVLNRPIEPPRAIAPHVPRDLETIVLECLAKDPERRYGSAATLADDLERFTAGRPIAARRERALVRAGRALRSNPLAALGLAGLLTGLISLGLAVALVLDARGGGEERSGVAAAPAGPSSAVAGSGGNRPPADGPERAEPPPARPADEASFDPAGPIVADAMLFRIGSLGLRHGAPIDAIAVSPDRKTVAVAGGGPEVRLWNIESGSLETIAIPDGRRAVALAYWPPSGLLAAGDASGRVSSYVEQMGGWVPPLVSLGTPDLRVIEPSLDGTLAAVAAGRESRVVHTELQRVLFVQREPAEVRDLALTAGGGLVAIAYGQPGGPNGIVLRRPRTGEEVAKRDLGEVIPERVGISPDGARVVVSGTNLLAAFRLPELEPDEEYLARAERGGYALVHASLAFGPDDLAVRWGRSGPIDVIQLPGGQLVQRIFSRAASSSAAIAFAGDRVVAGGLDGVLRVWEARTGERLDQAVASDAAHDGGVVGVAFAGERIVSVAADGAVATWRAEDGTGLGRVARQVEPYPFLSWLPETDLVVHASTANLIERVDVSGDTPIALEGLPVAEARWTLAALASPGGDRIAVATEGRGVRILDLAGSETLAIEHPDLSHVQALAWSGDGKRLAAASASSFAAFVFDADSGALIRQVPGAASALGLDELGGRLITGDAEGISVWSLGDGARIGRFAAEDQGYLPVTAITTTKDGTLAAAACRSGDVSVIQLSREVAELGRLRGHRGAALSVAFAPDGRRLASGGADTTVIVWDVTPLR